EMMNEHYWFCQPHAAEYNRNWNFFAGMSEGEIKARQEQEQTTGGRPTWDFKASRNSRESATFTKNFARGKGGYQDPFNLFGHGGAHGPGPQAQPARRLGKIERNALADLDLDDNAEGPAIRARYTELVKRCHPDANGGDRSAENKLQRVIKAYQALRKAGMV
ncbi:MAG: J domain-containing protein, partial [Phenylobacterium sp.]|nr:J domain-containing protein [Phenylobacterium sp.]